MIIDAVYVFFAELEGFTQKVAPRRGHLGGDLEPHRVPPAAFTHLVFDHLQKVVGFVFGDVDVGVSGEAKGVARAHLMTREEVADLRADDLFGQHETKRSVGVV